MKKTPFLDHYKEMMIDKENNINHYYPGMCIRIKNMSLHKTLDKLKPEKWGDNDVDDLFWGESSGESRGIFERDKFNEFRQTCILLCAALNNEL